MEKPKLIPPLTHESKDAESIELNLPNLLHCLLLSSKFNSFSEITRSLLELVIRKNIIFYFFDFFLFIISFIVERLLDRAAEVSHQPIEDLNLPVVEAVVQDVPVVRRQLRDIIRSIVVVPDEIEMLEHS